MRRSPTWGWRQRPRTPSNLAHTLTQKSQNWKCTNWNLCVEISIWRVHNSVVLCSDKVPSDAPILKKSCHTPMSNDSSSFFLVLILFAIWGISDNSSETYASDLMTCTKQSPDGKRCNSADVNGTYQVTLSKGSNTCAIGFIDKSESKLSGGTLTYVTPQNWRCVALDPIDAFPIMANMADGMLTISAYSSFLSGRLFDLNTEQNYGVWGTLKHWARLPAGMSCAFPLLSMKVCTVTQ
jgi:hypothetical protein